MAQYVIDTSSRAIEFECGRRNTARIVQNAKNLLMCRMGEVPYDRYRGFDPAMFDLPVTQMREKLAREMDRVMIWEPGAQVKRADCMFDENGELRIEVLIEVADA